MKRLLLVAAAATLALNGTAMAAKGMQHRHARAFDANALAAQAAVPGEASGTREMYLKNLRDSGYNPAGDRDAAGNIRNN